MKPFVQKISQKLNVHTDTDVVNLGRVQLGLRKGSLNPYGKEMPALKSRIEDLEQRMQDFIHRSIFKLSLFCSTDSSSFRKSYNDIVWLLVKNGGKSPWSRPRAR